MRIVVAGATGKVGRLLGRLDAIAADRGVGRAVALSAVTVDEDLSCQPAEVGPELSRVLGRGSTTFTERVAANGGAFQVAA